MDNEKKCGCNEEENTCGCGHDHGHSDECGCGEFEENEYILAQDPNEDSVYLFRSTEDGELIIPEEDEFDRVSKFYSEELSE